MPTSTMRSDAPAWRESTLTPAPPAAMFAAICTLTSCGRR
jgi:hypothetical protein